MRPDLHFAVQVLGYAILLIAMTTGGNIFCTCLLKCAGHLVFAPPRASASEPVPPSMNLKAGRCIGALERLIIMAGLIIGSWDILVAVIALKTVARYQELDKKIEAEYFLVGSLSSILWAIAVTSCIIWYDGRIGLHYIESLRALFPSGGKT